MKEVTQAAKLVRADLKAILPNIKFKVQSDSFSMGDSIDIYFDTELNEEQRRWIDNIAQKYQYGSFDGMTDSYNYSNRQDFPQSKFVMVNKVSDLGAL
jgi:hypothetical protein